MNKSKVAIVRCESYDEEQVCEAVKRGLELIGGIGSIVRKDERCLLKVNCLAGDAPDKAVTTNPSVFKAVAKLFIENNNNIRYGDSPGFEKPATALEKSGLKTAAEELGVELADFEDGKPTEFPQGMECKKFEIANACFETDALISLAKMKTHALTRITGAVKNQFGCVYGLHKASFHAKIPNPIGFSKMLVDLNNLLKPRLIVMDGIIAMEGNGPRGGEPVSMNCLIISTDPVAVDATFCRMINLEPVFVATNKYGQLFGLGNHELKGIEYVGDPLGSFSKPDFKVVRTPLDNSSMKVKLPKFIRNLVSAKPMIDPAKCIKCGICVNSCPMDGKALNFKDGKKDQPPAYDYNKCIRCYCCQEMCPKKAISVKGRD